jgi:predicted nuclease of predicted toxin-antitoxin system
LTQKIYLDDCAYDRELVRHLRSAGHEVVTPAQAGLTGRADENPFAYAADNGLVLLTKNPDDFAELHAETPSHPGILAIYQDNDPDRDMNYADVVRAIANLETASVPFQGTFHILNAWRY